MATGGPDLFAWLSEEILTCEICSEEFDSNTRPPRVLPCYHCYCGVCVEKLTKHGKLKCPKCRQEAAADKPFPMETLRVSLLDWKQSVLSQTGVACSNCGEGSKATSNCQDCAEFYCSDCTDYHRKFKMSKNHALVSLSEAAKSPEKLLQTLSEKCHSHPDEKLKLFCLTCDKAVCSICALTQHLEGHKFVELPKVLEDRKKKILAICAQLDKAQTTFQKKAEESEASLQALESNHRKAEKEVKNAFSSVVSTAMERQAEALEELSAKVKSEQLRLEEQLSSFKSLQAATQSAADYGRRLVSLSLASELTKASADLEKTVADLKEKVTTPVAAAATFQVGTEKLEELRALLESLGTIKSVKAASAAGVGVTVHLGGGDQPILSSDIRLDGSHCHGDCTVSADGYSLGNQPHPPSPSQSQQKFPFLGTCGTVALPGQMWPCVSVGHPASRTKASVCVRVESGQHVTLTPDMVNDKYLSSWNASRRTGDMMSRLLQHHWPKDENLLQFILTWSPIKLCLEKFYGHKEADYLTEACQCHLTEIIARIDDAVESLRTGKIGMTDFELMRSKRQSLQSVLLASARSKGEDADKRVEQWMKLLEAREEEVEAFLQHRNCLATLTNVCSHLQKVDSSSLMRRLGQLQEIKECTLDELCTPRDEDVILNQKSEPVVNPLKLPEEILAILPTLGKWQASSIFITMWRDEAVRCQDTDVTTATLRVWKTVSSRWNKLCLQIQNGSISFAEMNRHLRMFQGDEQCIRKELEMIADGRNAGWIRGRITQLERYRAIQNCMEGAHVILDFKTGLGITGDFLLVQRILEMGSKKTVQMNQLSDAVWNTSKDLQGITPEQVRCLKELENSKDLMQWLKESLPDGLGGLKVFVDLAFISAGEGDMEIDKVNCFHAAVTGYAPLIFDVDESIDFKTFMVKCQQVWRELDADRNLPEKLVSTRRYLPWLKVMQQSHGLVEVTALRQSKTINERGIYRVGNITKSPDLPVLDLEAVIDLRVPPDGQKVLDARAYSHRQLIDLQSRLMLVVGQAEKRRDNVEKFTMALDAIVRLGRVYISLCTDGCVLFNCWRARFPCAEGRSLCTMVEFGLGDNREALKAQRGQEHLEVFIMALAGCLETFHEEWTDYVKSKREIYQELNHFTVQQLVLLQQELIRVGPDRPPRPQVLALLSLVLPGCTQEQLYTAMQQAQEQILRGDAIPPPEEDEEPSHEEEPEKRSEEAFVQHLIESGFSRQLALAALAHVGPDDLDGGLVWCMEQDQDEETEMEQEVASTPDPLQESSSYLGWQATGESIVASAAAWIKSLSQEDRENVSVERLKASLQSIWTKFLEAVSSSVADYLSLEHLAIILQTLASMSTEKLCRPLPPMLKKSTPNLIVCPQVDVLKTVIHMYMLSPDQPLPRPGEVLLCNFNTTIDQVDGFLRRAFFASQGKLHCLVSADLLDYDVGEKTEKKLKEYVAKTEEDYQLLVVCSGENEYRARIVAALDRHRCHPPVVSNNAIRAYLRKKFSSRSRRNGVDSASHVDFDSIDSAPLNILLGLQTTAALVLQHWDPRVDLNQHDERLLDEISKRCRNALLYCATPDAVVRLKDSQLYLDEKDLLLTYFDEQQHDSLLQYLHHRILVNTENHFFAQVTTHSKLLTDGERLEIAKHLRLESQSAVLLTLQSFDTEQQFSQQIRNFVEQPSDCGKLLLVQCNSGHNQMDLLKCAQYSVVVALPPSLRDFYVVFIVQLPRIAGDCFSGFQAGKWHSLHIDNLRQPGKAVPSFLALRQLSPSLKVV